MIKKSIIIPLFLLFYIPANAKPGPENEIKYTTLNISVSGSAKRVPDIAIISAGVETISRDASAAISDNNKKTSNIISKLISIGILDKDISTASVIVKSIDHFQDGRDTEITGYQAYSRITVSFRNVEKISSVLKLFSDQGASQIIGPSMAIYRPNEVLNEARIDAINNANNLAEIYTKATNMKLVRIISITEKIDGDFSPRPLMMIGAGAGKLDPSSNVFPGEQVISVDLNVVFELQ